MILIRIMIIIIVVVITIIVIIVIIIIIIIMIIIIIIVIEKRAMLGAYLTKFSVTVHKVIERTQNAPYYPAKPTKLKNLRKHNPV